MFFNETQMLVFGLIFWLLCIAINFPYYFYKPKKYGDPCEEISKENVYFDEEKKVWLWEVDGHLFANEDFHIKQGGKIEDFENWIKEKEPIDSIESVISKKLN